MTSTHTISAPDFRVNTTRLNPVHYAEIAAILAAHPEGLTAAGVKKFYRFLTVASIQHILRDMTLARHITRVGEGFPSPYRYFSKDNS